ncbi:isoaspartyl peptidase/L-asparaginase family protein [Eudoraea sp.]|uniref:isoaspartyl peptidase/L-asparaginase family protein n=2 Tax=Eudoraea sp. TaxID=1979955 RepID=UPI003C730F7A
MKKIALAIHGGAGTLVRGMMTPEKESLYKAVLESALHRGYLLLDSGGSAVEAVEASVKELEDSHLFNAGKGSVFTSEGKHEMDASIMDGKTLNAGAVSLVSGIKNPISLARDVMEKSDHVFLASKGAMQFAEKLKYELEDERYFYDEHRFQQWQELRGTEGFKLDHSVNKDSKFGTVGAAALDSYGNLAAATSTGGMTNKQFGRVGDSPMIGAGNYANNKTCAVSCTGSGEYFIRGVVAYDLSCLMEYKNLTLQDAAEELIQNRLLKLGGDGGLIAVDALGNIAMPFNTEGMYRACKSSDGADQISIYRN